MPRFAANLSLLFTEYPLPQRFAQAAAAGFGAVEIQFPYDHPAETLAAAARAAGTPVILINVPAGDLMAGGPGLASHPDRRDAFAAALPQALHYAQTLGVPLLNILPGRLAAGHSRQACLATLAASLQLAAAFFAPHGLRLCCEAINDIDMPGFLLRTPDEVAQLLAELPQAGIGLQIDIYHAARMNLDIPALLARHLPQAAHIQFADYPGRGEPGSGTLPLRDYFDFIEKNGYTGWLGAEYRPTAASHSTLGWLAAS
jgi:hydroxypyruvate isomerase